MVPMPGSSSRWKQAWGRAKKGFLGREGTSPEARMSESDKAVSSGNGEMEDEANKLSVSTGDSGLSFNVQLVFQLSTAEHKSRDELAAAATRKPKFLIFKEILDEVCDRYENK